jgi:hypothetical protein
MTLVVISTYSSAIGAPYCPANEAKLLAVPSPRLTYVASARKGIQEGKLLPHANGSALALPVERSLKRARQRSCRRC